MYKLFASYFIYSGLPTNISYNWNYGSTLGIILILQIITGVSLGMHYTANIDLSFLVVEHIMRDINYGWLIRYMHANGASLFFLFLYLHIGRGIYAGSYIYPRYKLWISGILIYFLLMGTAFLGKENSLKRKINIRNLSNLNNNNMKFKYIKVYNNLHLIETQLKICNENRHKSGVYLIYNNINNKFYIGSAITNRINTRFRNHCIHGTGSSLLKKSIDKYGLENFSFYILEYYPGFIHKENLKKNHLELIKLEGNYINVLNPEYNILISTNYSLGYKHNKETIEKMRMNYSEERKMRIGDLNRNKSLSNETKNLMSLKMKKRYLESDYKEFLSKRFSKPLILYNKDGTIHSEYNSIRELSKEFKSCTKTINKAIKYNSMFKNIGYIKFKTK